MVQISSFGTKIETRTCAICVRSHAQICSRKIQGVCVTPVIKNVMSTARSTCCHRLTKLVTPGTNISVSFGEILGDWMKHLQVANASDSNALQTGIAQLQSVVSQLQSELSGLSQKLEDFKQTIRLTSATQI